MEHDPELEGRLRAAGRQPIDPGLQSAHLTQMASAVQSSRRRAKVRVAGIVVAGVLVGSTSLAAAGALPDPAQHFAHRALDNVGVKVPDPQRYHGPECGAEVKKNHGAYVRDDKALATSDCGKKVKAAAAGDEADDAEDETRGGKPKAEKGPCQGPPPWAGKDKASMTPEEKAKAQADRKALCGADDDEEEEHRGRRRRERAAGTSYDDDDRAHDHDDRREHDHDRTDHHRSRPHRSHRAGGHPDGGIGVDRWPYPLAGARRGWPMLTRPMVAVAQVVRAPGCGPGGRGFKSPRSPQEAS